VLKAAESLSVISARLALVFKLSIMAQQTAMPPPPGQAAGGPPPINPVNLSYAELFPDPAKSPFNNANESYQLFYEMTFCLHPGNPIRKMSGMFHPERHVCIVWGNKTPSREVYFQ
jgi:hypothetical protein